MAQCGNGLPRSPVPWGVGRRLRTMQRQRTSPEGAVHAGRRSINGIDALQREQKTRDRSSELRQIVDANSGIELSARIGRIFAEVEIANRQRLPAESINVIPNETIDQWKKSAQPVVDAWVKEISDRGGDGQALLDSARRLLAKYAG